MFKTRRSSDTPVGKSLKRSSNFKTSSLQNGEAIQISSSLGKINGSKTCFAGFYEQYRHKIILNELELVKTNSQDGVYTVPSSTSLQIWYGVIFIRTGFYAEGIFHFNLIIPDDYPDNRPSVRFTSKVFHPQVDETGYLNLDIDFREWKRGINHIWEILRYTQSVFYKVGTHKAVNEEAATALHINKDEFKARTRSCVLDSLLDFQEQEKSKERVTNGTDNPFQCTLLDKNVFHPIKKIMLSTKERTTEEQNGSVIHWAKYRFGQMINNLSSYTGNSNSSQGQAQTM